MPLPGRALQQALEHWHQLASKEPSGLNPKNVRQRVTNIDFDRAVAEADPGLANELLGHLGSIIAGPPSNEALIATEEMRGEEAVELAASSIVQGSALVNVEPMCSTPILHQGLEGLMTVDTTGARS